MLKVLFDKDMKPTNGWLKVSPGIFISHPETVSSDISVQAKLLNDTMSMLSPYLTQFYQKDLSKTPSLSGVSALLLRPDAEGRLFINGNGKYENVLTENLVTQLSDELKSKIKPIVAITEKTSRLDTNASDVKTQFHTVASVVNRDKEQSEVILSRISAQTPDFAVPQMFYKHLQDSKYKVSADAFMIGMYLLGNEIGPFNIESVHKSLERGYRSLRMRFGESASQGAQQAITEYANKLNLMHAKDSRFTEAAKIIVTQNLCNQWRDHSTGYDIYWAEDKIGQMTKLAGCESIALLSSSSYSWALSTVNSINGFRVPKILDCVTPYFPPAVQSLLPERRSSSNKRVDPLYADKAALTEKPYLLGCLYFHDKSLQTEAHNPLSVIDTSLSDICNELIFKPDTSLINLNQDSAFFEQFAHEISNKSCQLSIPGFQLKAPANITSHNGKTILRFAGPSSFTHIIKFPTNRDEKAGMVYAELFGMIAASAFGLETAVFRAVQTNVEMVRSILPIKRSDNSGVLEDIVSTGEPAFITELFDRPLTGESVRYMNEDFLSSAKALDKYQNSFVEGRIDNNIRSLYPRSAAPIDVETRYMSHGVDMLVKIVKTRSTEPDADIERLYRQSIANTLLGNGDAHLKNFSLLHRSKADGKLSVRLSPAYDIVCTRMLAPKFFFENPSCMIGLKYNPSRNEIITSGVNEFGLSEDVAISILDDVISKAREFTTRTVHSPHVVSVFNNTHLGKEMLTKCMMYLNAQVNVLALDTPDPDIGIDEEIIFNELYPNSTYRAQEDEIRLSDITPLIYPRLAELEENLATEEIAPALKL